MALIGRRLPPVYSPVSLSALASGWASVIGRRSGGALEQLEDTLRARFAAAVVVLTDSGTSALALAMIAALKRRPGAAVALPAYSCYDLATAAVAANVPVVLYDVDPTSLGPDWRSLDRALQNGTVGAVVVAHLYGMPVDLTRAAAACTSNGAVLIEDAAQGIGGTWNDEPLGSHGPLSVLSFGRGKGVTGGRGGALLARRDGVGLLSEARRSLGPARGTAGALTALTAQWLLARPLLYGLPSSLPFLRLGETVYREPHPPHALAGALALIVCDSLARGETETGVRRRRAQAFARGAELAGLNSVHAPQGAAPGYLRYPILLEPTDAPEASALGVMPGYPKALADLEPIAMRCSNRGEPFPGARRLTAGLRTLPTHSRLSDADVERILEWIRGLAGPLR